MDTEKKLKILLVITKGNWGGAQKYVYELATGLDRSHFDAQVLYGEGTILAQKLSTQNIQSSQIKALGRDINPWQDIVSFFKLISIFRKQKPDIVHLNSSKIGGLGALAARIAGIQKIVFTVHGLAFNEDRNWFSKIILKKITWFTIFFSTDTIFVSHKDMDQVKRWPFISRKLQLVHNGITSPVFLDRTTARNTLSDKLQKPELFSSDTFIIGTIGELTKNKGYKYGIAAIKNIANSKWLIIGEGEERADIEKQIKENSLENKVILAGFVENASQYLKAFDAFLLPSVKEGLPYVLIEASYASLSVIATNVGGVSEIIENDKTGLLIASKTSSEIENALKKLIASSEQRALYAKNLNAYVETQFTLVKMLTEIIKVYTA